MRKRVLVCLLIFCLNYSNAQTKITYEVTARNLSLEATDSYPQKIVRIERTDSAYKVVLTTFPAYDDVEKREVVLQDRYINNYRYPDSIEVFTCPTRLVDYRIPEIQAMADSLLSFRDSLTLHVIKRALAFTSRRIRYDDDLAQDLDQGRCVTLDVKTILDRGKGTCSEYTNLFMSLIRAVNIPCRMIVGYIYMPENNFEGSHAWAECYIRGYGWLAVDPQNGFYWYPSSAIKLFYGRDFIDCNIKTLPDMYPVRVKRLN